MPTSKPPLDARLVPVRAKASNYPEPYASQMQARTKRQLGEHFLLRNFGVNLTTLAPGGISSLRHAHSRQDEFVYVLSGRLMLDTNAGSQELTAGMCVGFPAGTGDAHRLRNPFAEPAEYLEVGDRSPGDEIEYPDDDLQALLVEGAWKFCRKSGEPY